MTQSLSQAADTVKRMQQLSVTENQKLAPKTPSDRPVIERDPSSADRPLEKAAALVAYIQHKEALNEYAAKRVYMRQMAQNSRGATVDSDDEWEQIDESMMTAGMHQALQEPIPNHVLNEKVNEGIQFKKSVTFSKNVSVRDGSVDSASMDTLALETEVSEQSQSHPSQQRSFFQAKSQQKCSRVKTMEHENSVVSVKDVVSPVSSSVSDVAPSPSLTITTPSTTQPKKISKFKQAMLEKRGLI